MFQKYTDIAMELHEMSLQGGFDDGIKISKTDFAGVEVSVADVPSGANKPKGVYYTLDVGRVWEQSLMLRRQRSEAIAGVIKLMTRGAGDEVLIVGIGNRNITPDSVGPLTADGVIATRHIRSQRPELYHSMGCGNVAVIAPGVMGQDTAQIMLVVGTDETGSGHPNWQQNLTFAANLQSTLNELYPMLARPVNIRDWPFNQMLCTGYLLVEVGSCGNTLQEALNAATCLGNALTSLLMK